MWKWEPQLEILTLSCIINVVAIAGPEETVTGQELGGSHAAWTASSQLSLLCTLPCRTISLHADLCRTSWLTETVNKYW